MNKKIYFKIHRNVNGTVLSLADKNLIGRKLIEGESEFHVTKSFFKGKLINEKEAVRLIKKNKNINIIGVNSVNAAIKAKVLNKNSVNKINGIPLAMIYFI